MPPKPVAPLDLPLIIMDPPMIAGNMVTRLGHLARTHLVTLAQAELRSSARDYVAGIQPLELVSTGTGPVAKLKLTGSLANMVEHGAGPWDLRSTLLKPGGKGVRQSKTGHLYMAVPFRHMGAGTSGKNAPALGSQFTEEGQQPHHRGFKGSMTASEAFGLGLGIQQKAKKLAASTGAPGGKTQWGGRLDADLAPALRQRHAGDIFAGMVRQTKKYEKATGAQYVSFRMISNNPGSFRWDSQSKSVKFGRGTSQGTQEKNWTHPGITARHLFPKTQAYLQMIMASGALGNPGAP